MRKKYAKVWVDPEFRDSLKIYAVRNKKKMVDIKPRDLGLNDFPQLEINKKDKRFKFKL